jgi:hypothetical protein
VGVAEVERERETQEQRRIAEVGFGRVSAEPTTSSEASVTRMEKNASVSRYRESA